MSQHFSTKGFWNLKIDKIDTPYYTIECTGVTGQSIPPAGLYPGLKRPRLDYTRVYYDLGQITPRSILWPKHP